MTEIIECVAIKRGDTIYHLQRPARHHDVIHLMAADGSKVGSSAVQGFYTDTGRFVDRAEALKIAEAAGQIKFKTSPEDMLFSEDLW